MIKKCALFITIYLLSIQNIIAEIDGMELALSEPYQNQQTLRWDNVVAKPLWLNDEKPIYFPQWNLQGIRLLSVSSQADKNIKPLSFWKDLGHSLLSGINQASQFFDPPVAELSPFYTFYLPPFQSFRLYNPDQALQPKDLDIYLSNGSGLLTEADVQRSTDGHSLIVSAKSDKPLLVHIASSGKNIDDIEMAAFISRVEKNNAIAPYQHLKWLPGKFVWLSKQPKIIPEIYWQMDALVEQTVALEGPARVLLKNRLHYEPEASQIRQDYRISYQLDDNPASWLNFSTEVEANGLTYINTQIKTLGRQQKGYIEIPAGSHLLTLKSDRNLYIRVLQQAENDYLLPSLNQPRLSVKAVRDNNLINQHELVKANNLAQTLVRDNSNRSAPLVGQQLLKQASIKHLEYKAASTEAKRLFGQRTFYKNLFPNNKNSHDEQFYAYFNNKKQRDYQRPQLDAVIAEQHQSAALKRVSYAYFSPVTASPSNFYLIERNTPTLLKIIVDKSHCQQTKFSLQMDQQPAKSFILNCLQINKKEQQLVRSMSETALLKLQQKTPDSKSLTLEPLFSSYRNPARLLNAASFEINLPQQIQQLTIKCLENEPCPLNLALQIRTSKSNQFSEQSYLAHMHNKSTVDLLKLMTDHINDQNNSNDITENQLTNQWVALKRFLSKQNRAFKSTIPNIVSNQNIAKESDINNWQTQALLAENNQQWVEALGFWNRIVENSAGSPRDQAQVAQATILTSISETYLAKSLWRYIALNAAPIYAKQAEFQLLKMYREQNNNLAIQQLAATRYIQRPNQQNLTFLLQTLVDNSKYRFALLLGLTLSDPPITTLLTAAYHLQWWQSYEQLLKRLPENQHDFWLGLKAQKFSQFNTALKYWNKAETNDWYQHLQQGIKLQQELTTDSNISEQYQAWSKWKNAHPGKTSWQDGSRLIKDSAGTASYYVIERDFLLAGFKATQQKPVKLSVLGPTKLNFKIRLLHTHADSQKEGLIDIWDNKKHSVHPYSNNIPVQGLAVISKDKYFPGNLISFEYQVGEGIHQIELSSKNLPIYIAIDQQQPEFPLTVLAPLQIDTFAHALATSQPSLKQWITSKPSSSKAVVDADLSIQTINNFAKVDNQADPEKMMLQYFLLLQKEQKQRTKIVFFAEKLYKKYPENHSLKTLWQKIARFSEWQSVESIYSGAGIRFIETKGWQPSNPVIQIRKALLNKTNSDEYVVFSDQRLVLLMDNLTSKKLEFEFQLDDISFLPNYPATFVYQIDQQKPQSVQMKRKQNWESLNLSIPAGQHQIRFWLSQPVTNQFLKIRFKQPFADLTLAKERSFFVSTKNNPLQLNVQEPSMLRIDEWIDNQVKSRYQEVPDGWQSILIPPSNKQKESLLQVKQRVALDQQKPIRNRIIEQKIVPLEDTTVPLKQIKQAATVETNDFFALGHQEDGTWSIGSDLVRRNNVQEDSGRGDAEDFQQFNLNHRYFDAYKKLYWDSKGFIRARKKGGPTLGLTESIQLSSNDHPFRINFEAKVISQFVHKDPEWLGQLKLDIGQLTKITPNTSILPKLSWFARYMSLRNDPRLTDNTETEDILFKEKVDQDIFTSYKSQHTTGLSASLLFTHDPWLDTRWTAKIKTVSNENMNLFYPDFFSTEAHWKQLMGDVSLDAGYRISFFQNDNDRSRSVKRHATRLKLNWQIWDNNKNRFEISSLYNYDIDRQSHLGMLSFSYHFGVGRKYWDFKPGTIDFRNIRERWSLNE